MKKIVVLVLFMQCILLQAQTIVYRKIAQRHDDYINSSWKGVDSFLFSYNSSAVNTGVEALKADSIGTWNNYYKYSYTLDATNKLLVSLRENWNGSAWVYNTRYTHTYDANGDEILLNYDIWNGSSWNQTGKIEYAGYNAVHKYGSQISSIWSGAAWLYQTKNSFNYYATGTHPNWSEKYSWDNNLSQWNSVERFTYAFSQDSIAQRTHALPFNVTSWRNDFNEVFTYNTSFLKTNYLYQTWDTLSSQWVDQNRVSYFYSPSNKLNLTTSDIMSSFGWNPTNRSTLIYDSNDSLIENYNEAYNGSWNNTTKSHYTYSGPNVTELMQYGGSGSTWYQTQKTDYNYDANNNLIFKQIENYTNSNFVPLNREFYYYNLFTVGTSSVLKEAISVTLFPNPCKKFISLEVCVTKPLQGIVNIIDALGKTRIMITQPLQQGKNQIQIDCQTLSNGMYFAQLIDRQTGNQITKRFQVIK